MTRAGLGAAAATVVSLALLAGAGLLLHRLIVAVDGGLVVARTGGSVLDGAPIVFEVGGAPDRDPILTVDGAGRPSANGRLTLSPGDLSPGLSTVAWEVRYLGRRPREATFSVLSGPFADPGGEVACAMRVAVGPAAAEALAAPLGEAVRGGIAEVPVLPGVSVLRLSPHLVDEGLDVVVDVDFDEGSRLHAMVPLALLWDDAGSLAVRRRGPVDASVTGTLGTMAAFRGGGITAALEALAREPRRGLQAAVEAAREAGRAEAAREIEAQVDRWLPEANRTLARQLPRRIAMDLEGGRVILDLSPCGEPVVEGGRAMLLRYHATPRVHAPDRRGAAAPAVDSVPGPLRLRDAPLPAAAPDAVPGLTLTFSEDLLNAVVHAAWHHRLLDGIVGAPDRIEALNATLSAFSPYRVSAVGFDLPPVLHAEEGGLKARVGELRLTLTESGRPAPDLVAHADAAVAALAEGLNLRLSLAATAVRASCSVSDGGHAVRHPCLSDLVGEAEAMLVERATLDLAVPLDDFADGFRIRLEGIRTRPGELDLVAVLDPG